MMEVAVGVKKLLLQQSNLQYMELPLLVYRLSGWLLDVIFIFTCWVALKKVLLWKEYYSYFLAYILSMTILELIYTVTALVLTNNLFLDYIYVTLEFILLGFFLKGIIKFSWVNILVITCSILFVLFQFFNAFWGQGIKDYNSYGALINNLYLISLSLLAFTLIFKRTINKDLFKIPDSWFVLGIFLIYSSIILFDSIYSLAVSKKEHDGILYAVLSTQNVLKSLFICCFIKGISLINYRN
jgi:hypothetical protein